MPGFDTGSVMYALNVDFTGNSLTSGTAQVTTNGQLLIGSTAAPNIRVGTLTAGTGVTITNGPGTITIGLAGGGAALEHLTGNTGGTLNPDGSNNINIVTANSTVKFAGAASTLTQDFGLSNLFMGSAGSSITSASNNIAVGNNALSAATSATNNVAVGTNALQNNNIFALNTAVGVSAMQTGGGGSNTFIGAFTGQNSTTGYRNVGVGYDAMQAGAVTGNDNVAIGAQALQNIISSTFTVGIGSGAGSAYTGGEANNICINASGIAGENNVTRIGTGSTSCFISGIANVATTNSQVVTINTATGQLGSITGLVGTWTDVTTATQALAVSNGYITDRGGGVTYTLPSTAALGAQIIIVGKLGITTIAQNAGQQIDIASSSSTVGATGTATGTNLGDCITLRCITSGASTIWRAESVVGNWTLA